MSEYPDRVLLEALNEVASRKSKWMLGTRFLSKRRKFGDTTMVFSLNEYGIPLLSSVYVPWVLVWDSVSARMRRDRRVRIGDASKCFDTLMGEVDGRQPQLGLELQDMDEAIDRINDGYCGQRPIISVRCCPCMEYTLQFILCYGGLSSVVKVKNMDLADKYGMAWVLAEAAMLTHYCAQRLEVSADRVVFSAYDCYLDRGSKLGRSKIGMAAYMRQATICFGRVAKTCKECMPGDIFVSGYMRASKSLCDVNCQIRKPEDMSKRSMSFSGLKRGNRVKNLNCSNHTLNLITVPNGSVYF